MQLLRSVQESDLEDLFALSHKGFITLPPDKDIILERIRSSAACFEKPEKQKEKNYYIFVIEDILSHKVLGTSLIHARHGSAETPHFFLKMGQEDKYSHSLQKKVSHQTLKLDYSIEGFTEIGGLIVHPDFRNHPDKLGKQLSLVRFLYMSLYPERFCHEVLAELLPPFDEEGQSLFWKAVGKKFLNMTYQEADELSQSNKEFILGLYPTHTIYSALLPKEVQKLIGRVGPETIPAQKMLEKLGLAFRQEIDPFDGGPHYSCPLNEILPLQKKISGKVGTDFKADQAQKGLASFNHPEYAFAAFQTLFSVDKKLIHLPPGSLSFLPEDAINHSITAIPL